MANVSVRNLDDAVHAALRDRAERNGRSMESEIRDILTTVIRDDLPVDPYVRLMHRSQALGGVDLELPPPQFESRALFGEDRTE